MATDNDDSATGRGLKQREAKRQLPCTGEDIDSLLKEYKAKKHEGTQTALVDTAREGDEPRGSANAVNDPLPELTRDSDDGVLAGSAAGAKTTESPHHNTSKKRKSAEENTASSELQNTKPPKRPNNGNTTEQEAAGATAYAACQSSAYYKSCKKSLTKFAESYNKMCEQKNDPNVSAQERISRKDLPKGPTLIQYLGYLQTRSSSGTPRKSQMQEQLDAWKAVFPDRADVMEQAAWQIQFPDGSRLGEEHGVKKDPSWAKSKLTCVVSLPDHDFNAPKIDSQKIKPRMSRKAVYSKEVAANGQTYLKVFSGKDAQEIRNRDTERQMRLPNDATIQTVELDCAQLVGKDIKLETQSLMALSYEEVCKLRTQFAAMVDLLAKRETVLMKRKRSKIRTPIGPCEIAENTEASKRLQEHSMQSLTKENEGMLPSINVLKVIKLTDCL